MCVCHAWPKGRRVATSRALRLDDNTVCAPNAKRCARLLERQSRPSLPRTTWPHRWALCYYCSIPTSGSPQSWPATATAKWDSNPRSGPNTLWLEPCTTTSSANRKMLTLRKCCWTVLKFCLFWYTSSLNNFNRRKLRHLILSAAQRKEEKKNRLTISGGAGESEIYIFLYQSIKSLLSLSGLSAISNISSNSSWSQSAR